MKSQSPFLFAVYLLMLALAFIAGLLAGSSQRDVVPPPADSVRRDAGRYEPSLTARWVQRGYAVHYALLDGATADGFNVADLLAAFTDSHPEVKIQGWQTYPASAGSAVLVIVTD